MQSENSKEVNPLVLVVDDDPNIRLLVEAALEQFGFATAAAEEGLQALSLVDTLKPVIILLDVIMPGMDGFETCRAIRSAKSDEAVPVIMMTASNDVDSIRLAYEAGATDFITKPLQWQILGHRVRYMFRATRVAEELRASEAKNRAILNLIPDLICRITQDGVLSDISGSVEACLFSPESVGKSVFELLPDETARMVVGRITRALQSGFVETLEYLCDNAGSRSFYEMRIIRAEHDQALCMVRDVTSRKKMEEELRKAQKLEAVNSLAAGIAHDFNNLLSVVRLNTEMAQIQISDQTRAYKSLDAAGQALLRTSELIRQFQTFSVDEAPSRRRISSIQLLRESVSESILNSNCQCIDFLPDDLWDVNVDPDQIKEVIAILTINAIDAMPGGGAIEISAVNLPPDPYRQAAIPLPDQPYVRISVRDHGVGIAKENIDKIFDPYFSTKVRCSQKGMGLGLSIAHSILQQHSGHISVESEPNVGTVCHLFLPAIPN
jgi:two-component system, cell cycle sensor histidine kinase and response regulator CckA